MNWIAVLVEGCSHLDKSTWQWQRKYSMDVTVENPKKKKKTTCQQDTVYKLIHNNTLTPPAGEEICCWMLWLWCWWEEGWTPAPANMDIKLSLPVNKDKAKVTPTDTLKLTKQKKKKGNLKQWIEHWTPADLTLQRCWCCWKLRKREEGIVLHLHLKPHKSSINVTWNY